MRILKKILIFIGVLIALVLIVSAFLPGTVIVQRSRVMQISKATAFEKVLVLQNWPKWMTWAKLDTNAVYTFSGEPASGKGAFYSWKGNKDMGEGKMTITETFGTDSIYMDLEFKDMGTNKVYFRFFEKDKGVEVNWAMKMEFPYFMRIMGLFIDGIMAPDFEGGLEGIEKLGVNEPAKQVSSKYVVGESEPMMCLMMNDSCTLKETSARYAAVYAAIQQEMKDQKVEFAGPPFAVTIKFDAEKDFYAFSAGIPVSAEVKKTKNSKIAFNKYGPQKCLIYDYYGAYDKMAAAYEDMFKYIAENKMEVVGDNWEQYVTDPMSEKDQSKWLTKIYIPIK